MGTFGLCEFHDNRCTYLGSCSDKVPVVDAFSWKGEDVVDSPDLLVSCRCGIGAVLTGDLKAPLPTNPPKRYPAGKKDGRWGGDVVALKRALTGMFRSDDDDALFVNAHGRAIRYNQDLTDTTRPTREPAVTTIPHDIEWDRSLVSHAVENGYFALAVERGGSSDIYVVTGVHTARPQCKPPRVVDGRVSALAWSGNGRFLILGMADGRVLLGDGVADIAGTFSLVDTIPGPVTGICWSVSDEFYAYSGPSAADISFKGVRGTPPLAPIPQREAVKLSIGTMWKVAVRLVDGAVHLWGGGDVDGLGWHLGRQPIAAAPVPALQLGDIGHMGEISIDPANDRVAVYDHAARGVAVHAMR